MAIKNMVNNNNLITHLENKKPVELVQELKDYEIKKSPLSPAARSKVINKSGSNYVSEGKDDYGSCIINGNLNYDNCYCSSDELDRQLKIIRNKRELEVLEWERRENEKEQREKRLREETERLERLRKQEEAKRNLEQRKSEASWIKKGWNDTFGGW